MVVLRRDLTAGFLFQAKAVLKSNRRGLRSGALCCYAGKERHKRLLLSVVDDDEMLRESLPDLLREFGFAARAFSSGQEFLSSDYVDKTRCLILDVAMPGMSGLDVQQELKRRGQEIPVIFITGQKDEEPGTSVQTRSCEVPVQAIQRQRFA